MADDLLPILTLFHREIVLPDIERVVCDAVEGAERPLRDEMQTGFDAPAQRLDRLETEYHNHRDGVARWIAPVFVLAALLASGAGADPNDPHAALARDLAPVIAQVAGAGETADTAVPVDQEPLHKLVLKNDYVEVLHVTIPPGQSTRFHTHAHDGVAVRLSLATISTDVPGKGRTPEQGVRPGDVSANAYAKQPLTHRVNNVGATTFEVLDFEFLKRPDGPKTEALAPPAAENDSARVYRWPVAPGAATPRHTHGRPYLIVAATPMQLGMQAPDGASMDHAIQAGDFHWIDSQVTHVLTNRGTEAGVIVEVELK